ncbi:MAG: NAD(P)H-dependent glycerol-3-phosphate dehydrogenase [Hyphomicrobiaceae bacterium]
MTGGRSIGVIGAGAWGTALALSCHRAGLKTQLWARDAALARAIATTHRNERRLPGIAIDPAIVATADIAEAAAADIVLMAAPAQALRQVGGLIALHLRTGQPVIIAAKGLEQSSGKRMSEVLAEVCPTSVGAVLSGPSFAADVAAGLPTAVTLAAPEGIGAELAQTIGHKHFRPYWTSDIIGVEIGGALKNVLAIAAGIIQGRGLGASAHAALVTRGFAELVRFGAAFGARPETLSGLSGLGDLILTASSPQSRNMALGLALGRGATLGEATAGSKGVSEGVWTAAAVVRLARSRGIDMPVAAAVAGIVEGSLSVDAAIEGLLSRPFRAEV